MQRENAEARRHIAFLTASRDELEQRTRSLSQQLDLYIYHPARSSPTPAAAGGVVGDAGRPPTPQAEDTIDVTLAAEKIREMQLKIDRLAANNRVLILELEEKRQYLHKYTKKAKHLQHQNILILLSMINDYMVKVRHDSLTYC